MKKTKRSQHKQNDHTYPIVQEKKEEEKNPLIYFRQPEQLETES